MMEYIRWIRFTLLLTVSTCSGNIVSHRECINTWDITKPRDILQVAKAYRGTLKVGILGHKCAGTRENDGDYNWSEHNKYCRWSGNLGDSYNREFPPDTAWCFDENNYVVHCEVYPCGYPNKEWRIDSNKWAVDSVLATALFTEGTNSIRGSYVDGLDYNEYVPSYFVCAVQRKAKSESDAYLQTRGVLGLYLRVKVATTSDGQIYGKQNGGRFGCYKGAKSYQLDALSLADVNQVFDFGPCSTHGTDAYSSCQEKPCPYSESSKYFFPAGRHPKGNKLNFEALKFKILCSDQKLTEEARVACSKKLWGVNDMTGITKYEFSCEAEMTDNWPEKNPVDSDPYYPDHLALARSPSLPMSANDVKTKYLGWREPTVEKLLIQKFNGASFQPMGEGGQILAGTILKIMSEVKTEFESHQLQVGVSWVDVDGKEHRFGCDTDGNRYALNDEEYLSYNVMEYLNDDDVKVTANTSTGDFHLSLPDCKKETVKKHVYRLTHLVKVEIDHASWKYTSFAKEIKSEYIKYSEPTVMKIKSIKWGEWGKWSECSADCATLSEGVITRTRQCERMKTSPDLVVTNIKNKCTSSTGEENQSTEQDTSSCGPWHCYSTAVTQSFTVTAVSLDESDEWFTLDVSADQSKYREAERKWDDIGFIEKYTDLVDTPTELKNSEYKINYQKEAYQDYNVPGGETILIRSYRSTPILFEWSVNVDPKKILTIGLAIAGNVVLEECWQRQVAPCQVNLYNKVAKATYTMHAGFAGGRRSYEKPLVFFEGNDFSSYYPQATKNRPGTNLEWIIGRGTTMESRKMKVRLWGSEQNINDATDNALYQAFITIEGRSDFYSTALPIGPLIDLRREWYPREEYVPMYEEFNTLDPMTFPSFAARPWFYLPHDDCGYQNCPVLQANLELDQALQLTKLDPEYPNKFYVGIACLSVPISRVNLAKVARECGVSDVEISFRRINILTGKSVIPPDVHPNFAKMCNMVELTEVVRDRKNTNFEVVGHTFEVVASVLDISGQGQTSQPVFTWPDIGYFRIQIEDGKRKNISTWYDYPGMVEQKSYKFDDFQQLACAPNNGGWSDFQCAEKDPDAPQCGTVTSKCERWCNNPLARNGGACEGEKASYTSEEYGPCPTNGNWGDWSSWTGCSSVCGYGTRMRVRMCDNPPTDFGGRVCEGKSYDNATCFSTESCTKKDVRTRRELSSHSDGGCISSEECARLGPGAVCDIVNSICRFLCTSSSQCRDGVCAYIPDPLDHSIKHKVCKSECDDAADCNTGEVCYAGHCRPSCDPDSTSPTQCAHPSLDLKCSKLNAVCKSECVVDNHCKDRFGGQRCIKLTSYHGDNFKQCYKTCGADTLSCLDIPGTHCYEETYCLAAGAYLYCDALSQCPPPLACDDASNKCVKTARQSCSGLNDCPTAQTCSVRNECEPFIQANHICVTRDDCGGNEQCYFGRCLIVRDFNGDEQLKMWFMQPDSYCDGEISGSKAASSGFCQCPRPLAMVGSRCVKDPRDWLADCSSGGCKDVTCVGDQCYLKCGGNLECPFLYHCVNGRCTKDCITTKNYKTIEETNTNILELFCDTGELCDQGQCAPTCQKDGDCSLGEVCDGGICAVKCISDRYCQAGKYCSQSGLCSIACSDPSPCPVGYACMSETTKPTCVKLCTPGTEACASHQQCVQGMCTRECTHTRDCVGNSLCSHGTCIQPCGDDTSCPSDLSCSEEICSNSCSGDTECAAGWKCKGGKCVGTCDTSPDQCADNQICSKGECISAATSVCTSDDDCDSDTNIDYMVCVDSVCQPSLTIGGECTKSSDCGFSGICQYGKCKVLVDNNGNPKVMPKPPACSVSTGESDCGGAQGLPGSSCVTTSGGDTGTCWCTGDLHYFNGACVPDISSCEVNSDCPYGQACKSGLCINMCIGDGSNYCASGMPCVNGLCGTQCYDSGSCSAGEICSPSGQCETKCEVIPGTPPDSCVESYQLCVNDVCRSKAVIGEELPGPTGESGGGGGGGGDTFWKKFFNETGSGSGLYPDGGGEGGTDDEEESTREFCSSVTQLRNGVCVPICSTDMDCPDVCVGGACSSSCSSLKPCPGDYYCMTGSCYPKCEPESTVASCGPDNQVCVTYGTDATNGVCRKGPRTSEETDNSGDGDGTSTTDEEFYITVPDGKGGEVETVQIACKEDSSCGHPSLICSGGFCTTTCVQTSQSSGSCGIPGTVCTEDTITQVNTCQVGCQSLTDTSNCPPHTSCNAVDGGAVVCQPITGKPCSTRLDCLDSDGTAYLLCSEGVCSMPHNPIHCISQSSCAFGHVCKKGKCEVITDNDGNPYGRFIPDFKGFWNPDTFIDPESADGTKYPCLQYSITGLLYNHGTGYCECPPSTALFGDQCLDVEDYGEKAFDGCENDHGCPDGMSCAHERCFPEVNEDKTCGGSLRPLQGFCVPTCTSSSHCAYGLTCEHGACTGLCNSNLDCAPNQICLERRCYQQIPPSTTTVVWEPYHVEVEPCTSDSRCPGVCVGGLCSDTCEYMAECTLGRICQGGRCFYPCGNGLNCPSPDQICHHGTCKAACKLDSECTGFSSCISGVCTVTCSDNLNCPQGCNQGICTSTCSDKNPCADGYECGANQAFAILSVCDKKCSSSTDCSRHQTCDGSGICKSKISLQCSTDSDCQLPTLYCHPKTRKCEIKIQLGSKCAGQDCGKDEVCARNFCITSTEWIDHVDNKKDEEDDVNVDDFSMSSFKDCTSDDQCGDLSDENKDVLFDSKDDLQDGATTKVVSIYPATDLSDDPHYNLYAFNTKEGEQEGDNSGDDDNLDQSTGPLKQRIVPSDGLTMLTCTTHDHCLVNQICVNEVCALTCVQDSDCASTQVCYGKSYQGICVEKCEFRCTSQNDLCLAGLCRDTCIEGQSTAYGVCKSGIILPRCKSEMSCPRSHTCEQGVCELWCKSDADCGSDQICSAGFCRTQCDGSETNCFNGGLFTKCITDFDCNDSRYCVEGICTPICYCPNPPNCAVKPCDLNNGWECSPQKDGCVKSCSSSPETACPPTYTCNTETGTCELRGHFGYQCESQADCSENYFCNIEEKKCQILTLPPDIVVKCTSSTPAEICGYGGECQSNGYCGKKQTGGGDVVQPKPESCSQSEDCRDGMVCDIRYNWCFDPDQDSVLIGKTKIPLRPPPAPTTTTSTTTTPTTTPSTTPTTTATTTTTQKPTTLPSIITGKNIDYFMQICIGDAQCPRDSTCVSGNCYPFCTSDICKPYTDLMQCYAGLCTLNCTDNTDCDSGQRCSGEGLCTITCSDNKECGRGQYCIAGVCSIGCEGDDSCEDGENCINKMCVLSCLSDVDCTEICVEGVCGRSCRKEADCADGSSCQAEACVSKCNTDTECAPTAHCMQGYCHQKCTPSDPGCVDECLETSDCAEGLHCSENVCVGQCEDDSNCGENFKCAVSEGNCKVECSSALNITCPSKLICDEERGICISLNAIKCDTNLDCAQGQVCVSSMCMPESKAHYRCYTHTECGRDELCIQGKCVCTPKDVGECVDQTPTCPLTQITGSTCHNVMPHSTCSLETNRCECEEEDRVRYGNRCVKDILETCETTCTESGSFCRGYLCYPGCGEDSGITCPDELICANGYCVYDCLVAEDCGYRQHCEVGFCVFRCQTTDDCLPDQRCHYGVCREICSVKSNSSSDCQLLNTTNTTECESDSDCESDNVCLEEFCQPSCNQVVTKSCTSPEYICQDGLCLKDCPDMTCESDPMEDYSGCGHKTVTADMCVNYRVLCPPTTVVPDGFTQELLSKATECWQVIGNSICRESTGDCVCQEGMVRYAGAVCYIPLEACSPTTPCGESRKCVDGYCYASCTTTPDCGDGTKCVDGACLVECNNPNSCLNHQKCSEDGYCDLDIEKLPPSYGDPPCTPGGRISGSCSDPEFEICALNGESYECQCTDGMRRSLSQPYKCEWLFDMVCFRCSPCSEAAKCQDTNMKCNQQTGMCVCKTGFKLDSAGTKCIQDLNKTTTIDCTTDNDCALVPKSFCDTETGKCVCNTAYCYEEKQCLADNNECEDISCAADTSCVNLLCSGLQPSCVDTKYTQAVTAFNVECEKSDECLQEVGNLTYCYNGWCACLIGALLVNGECEQLQYCVSTSDCSKGSECKFGSCVEKVALKASVKSQQSILAEENSKKEDIAATIIAIGMAVGILAIIMVTVFIRRNSKMKAPEPDNSKELEETKERVMEKQSRIEQRKSVLQSKQMEQAYKSDINVAGNKGNKGKKGKKGGQKKGGVGGSASKASIVSVDNKMGGAHGTSVNTKGALKNVKKRTLNM